MLQNLSHFLTQSYHPLSHFLIFVMLYQVVSYDCVGQKSFWLPKVVKASFKSSLSIRNTSVNDLDLFASHTFSYLLNLICWKVESVKMKMLKSTIYILSFLCEYLDLSFLLFLPMSKTYTILMMKNN